MVLVPQIEPHPTSSQYPLINYLVENADQACPRCEGAVYEIEKVQVKDRVFHKNCLSCKSCERLLDVGSICSIKLQDKYVEIFCQGCYSRFTGEKNILKKNWKLALIRTIIPTLNFIKFEDNILFKECPIFLKYLACKIKRPRFKVKD